MIFPGTIRIPEISGLPVRPRRVRGAVGFIFYRKAMERSGVLGFLHEKVISPGGPGVAFVQSTPDELVAVGSYDGIGLVNPAGERVGFHEGAGSACFSGVGKTQELLACFRENL